MFKGLCVSLPVLFLFMYVLLVLYSILSLCFRAGSLCKRPSRVETKSLSFGGSVKYGILHSSTA